MTDRSIISLLLAVVGLLAIVKAENDINATRTTIIDPPRSQVYVQAGHNFTLTCKEDKGKNVVWKSDVNTIVHDNVNYIIKDRTPGDPEMTYSYMTKINATLSDSGDYSCQADSGTDPSYSVQVYVFSIKGSDQELNRNHDVTLHCSVEGLSVFYKPIEWFKDGKKLSASDKYYIDDTNDTLVIHHGGEDDIGEYQCGFTLGNNSTFNHTLSVSAQPQVKPFERSKNLVQGDPLVLECIVSGHPLPTVAWFKGETEPKRIDANDERVEISDSTAKIVNGTLRITNMDYEDRDHYTCVATNVAGSSNSTILVRVKDKLAALWPFLGICAEVLVLCIIIFFYERRRAKKMEEEDTPEEAGHLTNSHDHKGQHDIRLRK